MDILGFNFNSVSIGVAGNFGVKLPTKEAVRAVNELLDEITERWKIPYAKIFEHREYANTECPGSLLPKSYFRNEFLKYKVSWLSLILLKISDALRRQ